MLKHFETLERKILANGFTVKHVDMMADFDEIVERHRLIVAAEAAETHKEWYQKYSDLYHPKTIELIEKGQKISKQALQTALAGREKLRDSIMFSMQENGIDLWLSPSAPGPAPQGLDSTGDPIMNLPWTHSGLPTLNLPSGVY